MEGSRDPVACRSDAYGDSGVLMDASWSFHCTFCELFVVSDAIDCTASCRGVMQMWLVLV